MNNNFSEITESFERAIGSDKQVYLKNISNIENTGIFKFNPALIESNLHFELQKQNYIKNLINKPAATKKVKPSKNTSSTKLPAKRSIVTTVHT